MVSYENRPKTFLGRLSQASRAMRTCFDSELKTLDLTLSRGRLMLHLVSASHVVTQSELTDVLEVEHPPSCGCSMGSSSRATSSASRCPATVAPRPWS